MSFEGSDVEVLVTPKGGATVDLASHAVIKMAEFEVSSGAMPAMAKVTFRDPDRELSFVTGSRLKLKIDGQAMWAGYVLRVGRSSFFPAGDGKDETQVRSFVVYAVDNNILLDKRIFRRTTDYLNAPPNITSSTMDGAIIRTALTTYFDMPSGFDLTTKIDDVIDVITGQGTKGWAWPEQGSKLRFLPESLSSYLSGAIYYIGPDDAFHYHAIQDVEAPWGFSDKPNHAPIVGSGGFEGAYWGFRELNADEDGSEFVTDAFVWGGSPFAADGTTVFKRATDTDLEDIHDRWQRAETHFNETNFKTQATVDQRANVIVFGNAAGDPGSPSGPGSVVGEGPRGLRFPQWAYSFMWHTKDVPSIAGVPRHLYPGDILPIQLWAFSEDGGVTPFNKFLPLRALKISFPSGAKNGKAHVEFRGMFDLRNEDPFLLWKYLRKREPEVAAINLQVVTDADTETSYGAFYQGTPTPATDDTTTTFSIPFGYISGTLSIFKSGLIQRLDIDWTEGDQEAGEFVMTTAPNSVDWLYATARTLDV